MKRKGGTGQSVTQIVQDVLNNSVISDIQIIENVSNPSGSLFIDIIVKTTGFNPAENISWRINNAVFSLVSPQNLQLDAADTVNNRFDLVWLDDNGAIGVTEGIPTPNAVRPAIKANQLGVAFIEVIANAGGGGILITNNSYVPTSGNWTINDVKTFTSFPVLPAASPAADYEAATKKYVDEHWTELDIVHAVAGVLNIDFSKDLIYVDVQANITGLTYTNLTQRKPIGVILLINGTGLSMILTNADIIYTDNTTIAIDTDGSKNILTLLPDNVGLGTESILATIETVTA